MVKAQIMATICVISVLFNMKEFCPEGGKATFNNNGSEEFSLSARPSV